MRRFLSVALLVLVVSFSTSASAQGLDHVRSSVAAPRASTSTPVAQPAADTIPQATGVGAIADYCKTQFIDPVAQTACEVYTRKWTESERGVQVKVEADVFYLLGVLDEHKKTADEQARRIEDLERQLAALEAAAKKPTTYDPHPK